MCELMNKYIDEEIIELVRNMIRENLPVSQISRIAGISEENVEEIKKIEASLLQKA